MVSFDGEGQDFDRSDSAVVVASSSKPLAPDSVRLRVPEQERRIEYSRSTEKGKTEQCAPSKPSSCRNHPSLFCAQFAGEGRGAGRGSAVSEGGRERRNKRRLRKPSGRVKANGAAACGSARMFTTNQSLRSEEKHRNRRSGPLDSGQREKEAEVSTLATTEVATSQGEQARKMELASNLHPNLAVSGLVSELPIFCPYRNFGCTEMIRLDAVPYHSSHCPFAPSDCSNSVYGCTFKGIAREIVGHAAECPYEKIKGFLKLNDLRISKLEALISEQASELEALRKKIPPKKSMSRIHLGNLSSPLLPPSSEADSESSEAEDVRGAGAASRGLRGGSFRTDVDGRGLVVCARRRTWPEGDLRCRQTISENRTGVTSVIYDNGKLYSGAYDGSTKVFNAASGELIRSMQGHSLSVWSLAVHNSSNRLFSAGSDGQIKVCPESYGIVGDLNFRSG
ncbi:hypothetical protein BDK51DRAFT_35204 [Blyttiomyces helicus]|uniref:SIAH-type domain-containing protein n=1 Tax=Blyttiomyces helicus TaxID=388810 RepID=A0A4P9W8V5_9FUNG|nr:hypothetical protein BDK51DRAFT_35204 [Blyttiomyces helicus]|eukprot:RKO87903.1 hypothetical protein BDK51DRAFT_35204 [Blyttiomyces helicus]